MVSTWPFIANGSDTYEEFGAKNWGSPPLSLSRSPLPPLSLPLPSALCFCRMTATLCVLTFVSLLQSSTPRARTRRSTGTIITATTSAAQRSATSTIRRRRTLGGSTGRVYTRGTTSTGSRSSGSTRPSPRSPPATPARRRWISTIASEKARRSAW